MPFFSDGSANSDKSLRKQAAADLQHQRAVAEEIEQPEGVTADLDMEVDTQQVDMEVSMQTTLDSVLIAIYVPTVMYTDTTRGSH